LKLQTDPAQKKKVAIIIPVHNGLALTRRCLAELDRNLQMTLNGPFDFKTIVIDDGSSDTTSQWIQNNHQNCILLQGDGTLWWSGAMNLGAKYAVDILKADYLLLWNNDIQVKPEYFSSLIQILQCVEAKIIIGSVIYSDPEMQTIWSAGGIFNPYTGKKYMISQLPSEFLNNKQEIEADWLTGMGTLIPKESIEIIGYWDAHRFPQYYGDSDYTYRAKINGFKIVVSGRLKIVNDLSNSGIKKVTRCKEIIPTLTSIKSIHNIEKNFLFYKRHARTPWAYLPFIKIYVEFFGGFIKRKVYNFFRSRIN
jgi:GT2 family glycosyltransferase